MYEVRELANEEEKEENKRKLLYALHDDHTKIIGDRFYSCSHMQTIKQMQQISWSTSKDDLITERL